MTVSYFILINQGEICMNYGYARVSTKGQAKDGNSLEAQEKALRDSGAEIIYKETFTGRETDRPELDKLLKGLQAGDRLIVSKLDRIARSAVKGIELVDSLLARGITVHILNMGILDDTPTGKLIRTIFLGFAEFERDMIVERTQEGKQIARENARKRGEVFREGRPNKYTAQQMNHAMDLLEKYSYNQVAEMTGISKSTLIRQHNRIGMKVS